MTDQKFVVVGTAAETTVTVSRLHASDTVPQGLVLEADHPLQVGEIESSRIVLWSDTAPDDVDIVTSDAGDLRMWNVWREGSLVQAWEADAHIDVDDDGDDLGLECFGGDATDEPDLRLRISFDRAWTQPADDD